MELCESGEGQETVSTHVQGKVSGPLAFLEAGLSGEWQYLPSEQTSACVLLLMATLRPVYTQVSTLASLLSRFKFTWRSKVLTSMCSLLSIAKATAAWELGTGKYYTACPLDGQF